MEMPLYHLPNARTIGLLVWQRSLSFVKKAGTTILGMALVIWALSVLPGGNLETSYLVRFGKWIEPVGRWMGFDWRLTVALITSFPAKENVIATLGVLFGSSPNAGPRPLTHHHFFSRHRSFLPGCHHALHPLYGHGRRHPPGNGFLGLDFVQLGLFPDPLYWSRRRRLPPRARPGALAMYSLPQPLPEVPKIPAFPLSIPSPKKSDLALLSLSSSLPQAFEVTVLSLLSSSPEPFELPMPSFLTALPEVPELGLPSLFIVPFLVSSKNEHRQGRTLCLCSFFEIPRPSQTVGAGVLPAKVFFAQHARLEAWDQVLR